MKRPLLLPLVPLYAAGLALRDLRLRPGWEPVRRLRYPVISIGNLSTGGSGKTPLALTLAQLLSARGYHVDVLSRGYGRTSRESARVRPEGTADQYGDEPLLIARTANVPVYVAAERYDAGQLAEADGNESEGQPRVHILDDGFQHRQLNRDIDVLLVSREDWHDHLLPAGNLRESLHAARRASILAIPADEPGFESELRNWGWTGPVWRLQRQMETHGITGSAAAFCGIARPEQFFVGLKAAGVSLVSQTAFPDHHRYTARDIERLVSKTQAAGAAALITTEKDVVRLGDLVKAVPVSLPLRTARLTVSIENESEACDWLATRLASSRVLSPL